MPLSSNSVIHLCDSLDSLLGILRSNFFVRYCREEYACHDFEAGARIPMVSFCDIPLSEIKDHIGKYGEYGIGLSKDWARRQALNPVLYIEQNSLVAQSIAVLYQSMTAKHPKPRKSDKAPRAVIEILRYIKNYEGELTRKGSTSRYRFSDEREWRYVPAYADCAEPVLELDSDTKDAVDNEGQRLTLKFEPNDIKYIVIRNDSEIERVIECLRRDKGDYSHRDIERLATRILTSEQIKEDI